MIHLFRARAAITALLFLFAFVSVSHAGPALPGAVVDGQTEPGGDQEVFVPPPRVPRQPAESDVRVAIGMAPDVPGSRAERALVDDLERSVLAAASPRIVLRRLRVGSAEARVVCREGRDDLVIVVAYLPDRDAPVLLIHDCLIDESLGVRSAQSAVEPGLVATLWAEHQERLRQGARERRRVRIDPRVRTALIAGSALVLVGVAVGFLVAATLRRDTVVLTVEP